jgi:hypothetical protein
MLLLGIGILSTAPSVRPWSTPKLVHLMNVRKGEWSRSRPEMNKRLDRIGLGA